MWLAAGAVALGLCFVTGLPGDWARRRAAGAVALLGQVITAAGIVGAVVIASTARVASWLGAVVALVVGIVLGEAVADQVATRVWGKAQ
jgi:hypothetical protein